MRSLLVSKSTPKRWIIAVAGTTAEHRVIVSIAGAILLQSANEIPHQLFEAVIGPAAQLLPFCFTGSSLALAAYAFLNAARGLKSPRFLISRRAAAILAVAVFTAATFGVYGVTFMIKNSFTASPLYSNDGTTIDQFAAVTLLNGKDPYGGVNIITAMRSLGQSGEFTTPLRQGPFQNNNWLDYPSPQILNQLVAQQEQSAAPATAGIETQVSYPAGAFLWVLPLILLKFQSVTLISAIALFIFAAVALKSVGAEHRLWVALLFLADLPLLYAAGVGSLDVVMIALTAMFWILWEKPYLSTIALGLALATKQQAIFFAIFFGIFLFYQIGFKKTLLRFGAATAIFFAINAPFILWNPTTWLSGNLAPITDPMFPLGTGLIALSAAHVLPLFSQHIYTILELAAFVAAIYWYFRVGAQKYPAMGFLLAMAPFWFAWRSLPSYFEFFALPALVFWLAQQVRGKAGVLRVETPAISEG